MSLSVSDRDVVVLCATQAIRDALSRYCRGLDRMERETTRDVFHPDATVNYLGMYEGDRDGLIDYVWEQHGALERHSHQMTNVLVDVDVEAGTATSEACLVGAFWTYPDEAGRRFELTSRNRYLDRWAFRDGRWAVTERVHLLDQLVSRPMDPPPLPVQGTRDHDDPSYAFFGAV